MTFISIFVRHAIIHTPTPIRFTGASLILCVLLLGCATKMDKMNDIALRNKWEGQHISDYIQVAGMPKHAFTAPNGNKVYVFTNYLEQSTKDLYIETDSTGRIIYWHTGRSKPTK